MKPGIVLFVVVLIVLVGGGIVLLRQGRSRDGRPGHKTLNTDATQASATRSVAPTADHPVSEQPLDTLSADGSGTAVAGAGAGGYTPDARRPLMGGETDAESSPDQS